MMRTINFQFWCRTITLLHFIGFLLKFFFSIRTDFDHTVRNYKIHREKTNSNNNYQSKIPFNYLNQRWNGCCSPKGGSKGDSKHCSVMLFPHSLEVFIISEMNTSSPQSMHTQFHSSFINTMLTLLEAAVCLQNNAVQYHKFNVTNQFRTFT